MTAPFYRSFGPRSTATRRSKRWARPRPRPAFSEFDGEEDAADERWAELAERCEQDTPETMRRLVQRAKEGRG